MSGRSLYQSVGAVTGKSGGNLQGLRRDASTRCATTTRGLTLREIIVHVLEASAASSSSTRLDKRRPRAAREPGRAGQCRRGVRDAGRLRSRRGRACPIDEHGVALFGGTAGKRRIQRSPGAEDVSVASPSSRPPPRLGRARRRDRRNHVAARPRSSRTRRSKLATTRHRPGQDAIQLMTVHSAKGLEFDCRLHHRASRRGFSRTKTRRRMPTASKRSAV